MIWAAASFVGRECISPRVMKMNIPLSMIEINGCSCGPNVGDQTIH